MEINILIDKEFKSGVKPAWLRNLVGRILKAENLVTKSEVGLVITGDAKIQELNKKYLDEDRPTDVMAFQTNEDHQIGFVNAPDSKIHLGEVIISYPQAVRQASEHNHPVEKELVILMIHGILHLLGYDHDITERTQKMRNRESQILKIIEEQGL